MALHVLDSSVHGRASFVFVFFKVRQHLDTWLRIHPISCNVVVNCIVANSFQVSRDQFVPDIFEYFGFVLSNSVKLV